MNGYDKNYFGIMMDVLRGITAKCTKRIIADVANYFYRRGKRIAIDFDKHIPMCARNRKWLYQYRKT